MRAQMESMRNSRKPMQNKRKTVAPLAALEGTREQRRPPNLCNTARVYFRRFWEGRPVNYIRKNFLKRARAELLSENTF